jgi:hypothetical protein
MSKSKTASTSYTSQINSNYSSTFESRIDGSMRLFGLPHQFTEMTDPRIGSTSNLGRCFTERLVLEAPIVCLKPGLPDFLPNKSEAEKTGFINAILEATNGNSLKDIFASIGGSEDSDDAVMYYGIKDAYSEMMSKVNLMCKMMAVFLGIADEKVPWAKHATFGTYDWRYYSFKNVYNDTDFPTTNESGSIGAFISNALDNISDKLMNDTQWIRFYVDSSDPFSESASNSTTTSMLESYTEKLESIAKELDVVSGMTGTDMSEMASSAVSSVDSYIQSNVSGDGAFATLLKRISGNTKQILSGGNFLIPEIWSQSEYNKSYNFTINLSIPYGNIKSWYIGIGVPLCHILGLCLPQQLTANTYKAPYLVKCYSKGWFNCNYGIIDSVSIDKGNDGAWSVGGLPNDVKISLSVKDLYSTLSIPVDPYENSAVFLNTGMLEFLMVNCGIDLTNQDMSEKIKIWTTILKNNFTDRFTSKPYEIEQYFQRRLRNLFNVI